MTDQCASQPRMTDLQLSEVVEKLENLNAGELEEIGRTTELPVFESSENDPPPLTAAEREQLFQPADPRIADAKARCHRGDESVLPVLDRLVDSLIQEGRSAGDLLVCLRTAVTSGNEPIVDKLLCLGVLPEDYIARIAIEQKAVNILSLFVRFGWDINKETEWCEPPALSLALGPDVDVDERLVSWFISNGANPDAACGIDLTPLSYAVQFAPFNVVKMLFEALHFARHGQPRQGQLLHHAASRALDDCGEVCQFVLERCDFGINDIMYYNHEISFTCYKAVGLGTPLHEAARYGKPGAVLVLLEHGADSTILDSDGRTVLEVAEISGNKAVMQCLQQRMIANSGL